MKSWIEVVEAIKNEIENEGYSDVGDGAEIRLGCTRSMLDAIILHMIEGLTQTAKGKGYRYKFDEINRDGVKTCTYVLREEVQND